MNDVSDTELFSAYLDGELTAEEQVRAEQILATSPDARQLLEELRALSGTLQSLPQVKLGEELSARVLAIAERRMLAPEETDTKPAAGRAAAALKAPRDDSGDSEGFPWHELSWRGMLRPRALIWSAIVIVVAIFIHFNSPPPQPPRQIAKGDDHEAARQATSDGGMRSADAPKDEKFAKKPAAAPPAALAKNDAAKKEAATKDASAPAPVAAPAPAAIDEKPAVDQLAARNRNATKSNEAKDDESIARKEDAPAPLAAPQMEEERIAQERAKAPAIALAPAAASPAPASGAKQAPPSPAPAIAGGMLADSTGRAKQPETLHGSNDGANDRAPARFAGTGGGAGHEPRRDDGKQDAAPLGAVAKSEAAPDIAMADKPGAAAPAAPPAAKPPAALKLETAKSSQRAEEPATIVRFTCSTEAARDRVFSELLAENNLVAIVSPDDRRTPAAANKALQAKDGNFAAAHAAEKGTAPSGNAYSADATTQQRQIAAQSTPRGAELSAAPDMVQNGVSSAAMTAKRGARPSASAMQNAAAQNATSQSAAVPQSPPAEAQQGNVTEQSLNTSRNETWNVGQGSVPTGEIYYECDVTPEQLDALIAKIGEHRDAFSPPVVTSSATAIENRYRRAIARKSGDAAAAKERNGVKEKGAEYGAVQGDSAQGESAQGESAQHAMKNAANGPAGQPQLDADSKQQDKLRDDRAKPQAAGEGGRLNYQSRELAFSDAATGKTRVRFVLNVVDRVAPPPAPAAAAPAPSAPAKAK